jgi:heat shock protein HslJ
MKKLLLLITTIFVCAGAFGQDPDLFRTWYLYELQSSDLSQIHIVSEIDPSIQPFITIEPNLEFSGLGACNTFSGSYSYQLGELTSMDLSSSIDDCIFPEHNIFEDDYFYFMTYFWFTINLDGNGLELEIGNPIFGYAIFKDYELSVQDDSLNTLKLSPNPVSDVLSISSEGIVVESLSVYSITGQRIIHIIDPTNQIDVSSLSEGLYLLEITSENGRQIQKFIKK